MLDPYTTITEGAVGASTDKDGYPFTKAHRIWMISWSKDSDFHLYVDDIVVTEAADSQGFCGDPDHPRPEGDLDENCYVDINDFAIWLTHWLECNNPDPNVCE